MKQVKGICFDLFSTLVSVRNVPESIGAPTAEILGLDVDSWNEACFGPHHEICKPTSHEETLRQIAHSLDKTIPDEKIIQATIDRQARFDHALTQVDAGILEALSILKQAGFRLALVSNASTAEVVAWQSSPLRVFFDTVLFSCECGYAKPGREIYEQALFQLGLDARQCLFVGDGGSDEHFGAAVIGMKPVLSSYFLNQQERQKRLEKYQGIISYHIRDMNELTDLLGQRE